MRGRLGCLAALMVMGLAPVTPAIACQPELSTAQDPKVVSYDGETSDHKAFRVLVSYEKNRVRAQIAVAPKYEVVSAEGAMPTEHHLVLETKSGILRGRFETHDPRGTFGDSPLSCEVITGTWTADAKSAPVTIYMAQTGSQPAALGHSYEVFGAKDDRALDRHVLAFWRAVAANDRQRVAKSLTYPLTVRTRRGAETLRSPAACLAAYDRVFTAANRRNVSAAIPVLLSATDEGAMLGNGLVWFNQDGRVTALNF